CGFGLDKGQALHRNWQARSDKRRRPRELYAEFARLADLSARRRTPTPGKALAFKDGFPGGVERRLYAAFADHISGKTRLVGASERGPRLTPTPGNQPIKVRK